MRLTAWTAVETGARDMPTRYLQGSVRGVEGELDGLVGRQIPALPPSRSNCGFVELPRIMASVSSFGLRPSVYTRSSTAPPSRREAVRLGSDAPQAWRRGQRSSEAGDVTAAQTDPSPAMSVSRGLAG